MKNLIDRILDPRDRSVGGEYEVTKQIWDHKVSVATTTVTTDLFQSKQSSSNDWDVTNIPWDKGEIPEGRNERIYGVGVAINSIVAADVDYLQYGALLRIKVADGRRDPKMEPVLLRFIMTGGGIAGPPQVTETTASDGYDVNAGGQGKAAEHFALQPSIDALEGQQLRPQLVIPTALSSLSATTVVVVSLLCLDIVRAKRG